MLESQVVQARDLHVGDVLDLGQGEMVVTSKSTWNGQVDIHLEPIYQVREKAFDVADLVTIRKRVAS